MAERHGKPPFDGTMHHVYLLRSVAEPRQTYVGLTDDMSARLKSHNEGANFHAAEEASAVVGQRAPRYPVMRDGTTVWNWVKDAYPTHRADPTYRPVGRTVGEFARRVGMER